jgi:hypothetical protein
MMIIPYLEQVKWVFNLLNEELKHILHRYLDVAYAKHYPLRPIVQILLRCLGANASVIG